MSDRVILRAGGVLYAAAIADRFPRGPWKKVNLHYDDTVTRVFNEVDVFHNKENFDI